VMESAPLFSVIIPTYNRADKLQRALAALAEQSCRDFEVLVCDDGSSDHTAAVVAAWQGHQPIRHLWEPNWGGPARPRNRGIQAARGTWLCFLDADDWWYPRKLERILPLTTSSDVIYHACDVYTPRGKQRGLKKSRQLLSPVFADLLTGGNGLITSSVCVRRELLLEQGGFSEDKKFVAVEDYDLWLRLALQTERFAFVSDPLGAYWSDGENISGFTEQYIAREMALADRYLGYLQGEERREAERVFAYKIGIARKSLRQYGACRPYFVQSMGSRQARIRLYSLLYYLLALLHCPYVIR